MKQQWKNLLAIVAIIMAILAIFLLIRVRYDRLVKQIWRSLKIDYTNSVFTKDMVIDLDEPVQRYFLHAIAQGTPLAAYVELEMNGSFRLKSDAEWIPMQASQIISTSPGFVWQAVIGKGLNKFSGADYYANGKGRMRFYLWGLIPLVNAQDSDIDRSAVGRLGGEYGIWLPSALLPQNGVTWQAISDNKIQAKFEIDREPIVLTLTIDADGKLLKLSLPRWGEQTKSDWQYIPFGGEIQTEKTFGGYTVPTKISAGYWFGTEKYQEFFQSCIKQAKFS